MERQRFHHSGMMAAIVTVAVLGPLAEHVYRFRK